MKSKIHTGITGKARESLAKILDHVLQDECSLLATTRDYRWNVTGPNLYSLHRLFDEQRRQLDFWLQRVMERTKLIGLGKAIPARMLARAEEAKRGAGLPARTMIGDLLRQHEGLAHRLRDDLEHLRDPVTADLLQGLVEFHETTAWMLRMVDSTPGVR